MTGRRCLPLWLAPLAAAAVSAAPAAAAGSPAQLAIGTARAALSGKPGVEWNRLHPRYKRVVGKQRYVACARKAAAQLGKIRVKSVVARGTQTFQVKVAPLGRIRVSGVRLGITWSAAGEKAQHVAEISSFWTARGGTWVKVLVEPEYQAYKAGRCP